MSAGGSRAPRQTPGGNRGGEHRGSGRHPVPQGGCGAARGGGTARDPGGVRSDGFRAGVRGGGSGPRVRVTGSGEGSGPAGTFGSGLRRRSRAHGRRPGIPDRRRFRHPAGFGVGRVCRGRFVRGPGRRSEECADGRVGGVLRWGRSSCRDRPVIVRSGGGPGGEGPSRVGPASSRVDGRPPASPGRPPARGCVPGRLRPAGRSGRRPGGRAGGCGGQHASGGGRRSRGGGPLGPGEEVRPKGFEPLTF